MTRRKDGRNGMETIPERGHVTHKGPCSNAGSFPHQRETFDAKDNIRVVSIFNGARTASEVIHQAAVKKILYENPYA
jgi:hypothetical protein